MSQALKPFPGSSCTKAAPTKELKFKQKAAQRRAELQGAAAEDEDGAGGSCGAPCTPQHAGSGAELSHPWKSDECGGGGEGFLTGTLWEKQNLCCGSLTARPAPSPREPVRRHKPRQLAPDIGEGM